MVVDGASPGEPEPRPASVREPKSSEGLGLSHAVVLVSALAAPPGEVGCGGPDWIPSRRGRNDTNACGSHSTSPAAGRAHVKQDALKPQPSDRPARVPCR